MLHWSKEHWSIGALEHRSKEHPIRSPHRAWKDVQAPHRAPGTKMIWVFRCNIPSDIESILKSLWCKCVVYICVCLQGAKPPWFSFLLYFPLYSICLVSRILVTYIDVQTQTFLSVTERLKMHPPLNIIKFIVIKEIYIEVHISHQFVFKPLHF